MNDYMIANKINKPFTISYKEHLDRELKKLFEDYRTILYNYLDESEFEVTKNLEKEMKSIMKSKSESNSSLSVSGSISIEDQIKVKVEKCRKKNMIKIVKFLNNENEEIKRNFKRCFLNFINNQEVSDLQLNKEKSAQSMKNKDINIKKLEAELLNKKEKEMENDFRLLNSNFIKNEGFSFRSIKQNNFVESHIDYSLSSKCKFQVGEPINLDNTISKKENEKNFNEKVEQIFKIPTNQNTMLINRTCKSDNKSVSKEDTKKVKRNCINEKCEIIMTISRSELGWRNECDKCKNSKNSK